MSCDDGCGALEEPQTTEEIKNTGDTTATSPAALMDAEEAKRRLTELIEEIDAQTRRPGEEPLRTAVARQARQRLREMDVTDQ